jgi:heme-degrading monooxygenase HmoA
MVVFVAHRDVDDESYHATWERMVELVSELPGFLGYDTARTPGGLGITVSYFADAGAIAAWRKHPEHRLAQQAGRKRWYTGYAIHVGEVSRSYRHEHGSEEQQRP